MIRLLFGNREREISYFERSAPNGHAEFLHAVEGSYHIDLSSSRLIPAERIRDVFHLTEVDQWPLKVSERIGRRFEPVFKRPWTNGIGGK